MALRNQRIFFYSLSMKESRLVVIELATTYSNNYIISHQVWCIFADESSQMSLNRIIWSRDLHLFLLKAEDLKKLKQPRDKKTIEWRQQAMRVTDVSFKTEQNYNLCVSNCLLLKFANVRDRERELRKARCMILNQHHNENDVLSHSHFGNIIIILSLEIRRPESKSVSSLASFSQP